MNNSVYIICNYRGAKTKRDLNVFPSGLTYLDYVKDVIKSLNYKVHLVSLSESKTKAYLNWETIHVDDKEEQHYLATLKKSKNGISFALNLLFRMIQLSMWLIKNTNKNDKIFVYHNNSWSYFYSFVEFVSRRRISLLVAEIFGAVYDKGQKNIEEELERIGSKRKCVFINDILPQIVNTQQKYAVCYGNYNTTQMESSSFDDKKTHVVYAGKIDSKNVTDAFLATEVALYLDERYFIHVLGYGSDKDILKIQKRIEEINSEKGFAIIKYEGCLSGTEYDSFLHKCKIGLCTRALSQKLSDYCFPSKTLVYLAHNLIPVCPNLRSFSESRMANGLILVSNDFTPQSIASSIMALPNEKLNCDYSLLLKEMDSEFKTELKNLLED